jgi:Na+-transporting methylmalonyl-CoA/oxaloacetate decarboxylase gamma subunit
MIEGLFISLVGMVSVFVILVLIMLVMMGIERVFRDGEVVVEEAVAGAGTVVDRGHPDSMHEVAAIAVGLAAYLGERGRELGTSLTINNVRYEIGLGDISAPVGNMTVDGEAYRASVGDEGLPVAGRTTWGMVRDTRDGHAGRAWRSVYPPSTGGYWSRRGWTGRVAEH